MSDTIKQVTDLLTIEAADEYDQMRGGEWRILTSSNGWQWCGTNAIDRPTAEALRDALTELLETPRPTWTYQIELWDAENDERITDTVTSHFAPGKFAAREIVKGYTGVLVTGIAVDGDGSKEWTPIMEALKGKWPHLI